MTTEDIVDIQTVEDEVVTQSHSKIFNKPICVLALVTGSIFIAETMVMIRESVLSKTPPALWIKHSL